MMRAIRDFATGLILLIVFFIAGKIWPAREMVEHS